MPGEKFSRSEEAPQVLDQGARSPDSMNLRRSSGVIEKGKKAAKVHTNLVFSEFCMDFSWHFQSKVHTKRRFSHFCMDGILEFEAKQGKKSIQIVHFWRFVWTFSFFEVLAASEMCVSDLRGAQT